MAHFAEMSARLMAAAGQCWEQLTATLLSPTADFSVFSLLSAFLIAACFVTLSRGKRTGLRVLVRALLPRRWLKSRSARADLGLLAINTFVSATLVGWAIVSAAAVEQFLGHRLDLLFGTATPFTVSRPVMTAILTVSFYLAYELAYFVDHYLSHHIPLLWHFHKVHHTAETLSPATNYRVHPIDSLVFYNIAAVCIGSATALASHLFAAPGAPFSTGGTNAILLITTYLLTHLHHSHMWIAFTGKLGRIVLSPAHHQLHHSSDPAHFNRNFGNTLALFDHLAGTLKVPTRQREKLVFGGGPMAYDPHGVSGLLIRPFADATASLGLTLERPHAEPKLAPNRPSSHT